MTTVAAFERLAQSRSVVAFVGMSAKRPRTAATINGLIMHLMECMHSHTVVSMLLEMLNAGPRQVRVLVNDWPFDYHALLTHTYEYFKRDLDVIRAESEVIRDQHGNTSKYCGGPRDGISVSSFDEV